MTRITEDEIIYMVDPEKDYSFEDTDSSSHRRANSGCKYATSILGTKSACLKCLFENDCCILELDDWHERRALIRKYGG